MNILNTFDKDSEKKNNDTFNWKVKNKKENISKENYSFIKDILITDSQLHSNKYNYTNFTI
jgi:hypothetical protein